VEIGQSQLIPPYLWRCPTCKSIRGLIIKVVRGSDAYLFGSDDYLIGSDDYLIGSGSRSV
jgi:hypothetical protein